MKKVTVRFDELTGQLNHIFQMNLNMANGCISEVDRSIENLEKTIHYERGVNYQSET